MRSGRHSAQFTVLKGGRTLNVGIVNQNFDPKKETNATDTPAGWGFDSESGGYWHDGELCKPDQGEIFCRFSIALLAIDFPLKCSTDFGPF